MNMETPAPFLEVPGFVIDVRRRLLLRRETGETVGLNAKAFDTLLYLAQHPGEVLDKDTLLGAIWPGVVVEENSLAQNISALRQALGETHGENRYIATVPRRGYQFVAAVSATSELPTAPPADSAARTRGVSGASKSRHPYAYWLLGVVAVVAASIGAWSMWRTGAEQERSPGWRAFTRRAAIQTAGTCRAR